MTDNEFDETVFGALEDARAWYRGAGMDAEADTINEAHALLQEYLEAER